MKGDNCTGTVNVQGDASGRSKLIVQILQPLLREHGEILLRSGGLEFDKFLDRLT